MSSIKKAGINNTIISYLGIILGFINLIIAQPYFLNPEELGLTRVLFSFSALLAAIIPFGIGNITTKYFPEFRNREEGHYGFLGFILLYPLIGYLLCCLIILVFKRYILHQYIDESPLFTEYFSFVFPLTFFIAFCTILNVYSFSLFKSVLPSFLNDIGSRILSITVFGCYFLGMIDLPQMVFFFVMIYGVQMVCLLIYVFSIDRPKLKIDLKFLKSKNPNKIVKYGLLMSFASFSSLSLKYLDAIILAKYEKLFFVGIYTVAAFIPTVIEAPVAALEKIANAKIAEAYSMNNMEIIKRIYYLSVKYFMLLGGLLLLGVVLNIEDLLNFLPKDYHAGWLVVIIISISAFFNMATGVNNAIIFNSEKYVYGTYLLYGLVALAVILNLILIPVWGMEGAALATAISAFIYNFLKFFLIRIHFKLQPYNWGSLKILAIIIACYAAIRFIDFPGELIMQILLRSVSIVMLFSALTYFSGLITNAHIKELQKLFK